MKAWSVVFISSLLLLACRVNRQSEDYHFQTQADLALTADNHPHGFRQSDCFFCHLPQNIHQEDRLAIPSFAYAKVLVQSQGLASCSGCHGTNGVNP